MIHKYLFTCLLALLTVCSLNTLHGQTTSKKKVIVEKKIVDENGNVKIERQELEGEEADVFIMQESLGEGDQEIEITINAEMDNETDINKDVKRYKMISIDSLGNEEVLEWDGSGEMPVKMKAAMDQQNNANQIDIKKSEGSFYKIKTIDDDGTVTELEWDGEGEMPVEMKKHLDDNNIDLPHRTHSSAKMESEESGKLYKMKIKDKDGKITEMEWDGIGEMPAEMKKHMEAGENVDIDIDENSNSKIIRIEEVVQADGNQNKAQLGVMIENDPAGVKITGFAENSPAKKSGLEVNDIITIFDDETVKTIRELVEAVGKKKVGDQVEVFFIRGDLERSVQLTLGKRQPTKTKRYKWKDAKDH